MLILAGDTSSKTSSVAICDDEQVLVEINLDLGLTHSETFFESIEYVLNASNKKFNEIDLFACVNGPGSFTGTRIGVSAMKMMAYACSKPIVGISSLQAMSEPLIDQSKSLVCPMIDARNNRVFMGGYNTHELVIDECAVHIDEAWAFVLKYIKNSQFTDDASESLIFCGDTQLLNEENRLQKWANESGLPIVIKKNQPILSRVVARLAKLAFNKNSSEFLAKDLMVKYLVPSQAEQSTGIILSEIGVNAIADG